MCIKSMDSRSKQAKTDCCLRKTMKRVAKLRLTLIRVSAEETEALRRCGPGAVRATIRKYIRREAKRVQLARLAEVLVDIGKKEKKMESVCEEKEKERERRQPAGAMAPENTTQYLMGNVYEDMTTHIQTVPVSHDARLYSESMSPRSVYEAMDIDYEGCLDFQERDFDAVFNQSW